MKDSTIYIGVEIFFLMLCTAFGVSVWGNLIGALSWLGIPGDPYLWAVGFMFVVNLAHFLWGFFHTDDDISDIPTRGMMTNYFDYYRIGLRIVAFLTIGPSMHLQRAIELSREDASDDDV